MLVRIAVVVLLAGFPLARSAASQTLIVVPTVGFADELDRGIDVRLALTPLVQLAASAYYWDGLEFLCGAACAPQETGWSYGVGARIEGAGGVSRVRPFAQVEAGVHWFDGALAESPGSEFFWSGRGGGSARLSGRVRFELGVRLQRIPAYSYVTESVQGRITLIKPATVYFALTTGLAVVVF